MSRANKQNSGPCIVFPMGIEAYQFLQRVELLHRWKRGKAIFRRVFFEGREFCVVRCGMGPERAAEAIRNLDEEPSAIICAGSAGGIVTGLKVGHLVVSSETVADNDPAGVIASHHSLAEKIATACRRENLSFRVGRIVTVRGAVFPREDRERLHLKTLSQAVDMESHAIAAEALKRSVPFAALRVISDDLDSPPLPDYRAFTKIWRKPLELHKRLPELWRWRIFLKDFRCAVGVLHPVLVRVIREFRCGSETP
jgi:nucleoside phosphorylase